MSLDPFEGMFGRPMSLNGYLWVEGNVINGTDPTGEFLDTLTLTSAAYSIATAFGISISTVLLLILVAIATMALAIAIDYVIGIFQSQGGEVGAGYQELAIFLKK